MKQIGFGGGCHWCTEAVFQSIVGVEKVKQGWIASKEPYQTFSEAVWVYYSEQIISLKTLIEIHLLTHSSTNKHSMRDKYRSAIYYFNEEDKREITQILEALAIEYNQQFVTLNIPFVAFKENIESQLNYFKNNREAPFCVAYIHPKLALLKKKYSKIITTDYKF